MRTNSCKTCGAIQETASLKLIKLKKKIDKRVYEMTYGNSYERAKAEPDRKDLWEWSEYLRTVLGDL